MPEYIMHGKSIKTLVDRGTIVIASGGGGIPVFNNNNGHLEGLDAVIDKDFSAAKLGRIIKAQELWIITDIDSVYLNFGTRNQKRLKSISKNQIEKYYSKGEFQKGSMEPKNNSCYSLFKASWRKSSNHFNTMHRKGIKSNCRYNNKEWNKNT